MRDKTKKEIAKEMIETQTVTPVTVPTPAPLEEKKIEPVEVQPHEQNYLELVEELAKAGMKVDKYFRDKIKNLSSKYKISNRYPLSDYEFNLNNLTSNFNQLLYKYKMLPEGIDKAIQQCDKFESAGKLNNTTF